MRVVESIFSCVGWLFMCETLCTSGMCLDVCVSGVPDD